MPRLRPRLRLRLGSIDEHPEYSLNLGAESPASNLSFDDDRVPTPPPQRVFSRRTKSVTKVQRKRDAVDRDCGICFEYAVQPSRTLCCGKIFCLEHITDWLHGPSSDGCCPSCSAPCSATNILSLASPTLRIKPGATTSTSQDANAGALTTSPTSAVIFPRNRSQSASTNNTTTSVSTSGSRQSRSSTTTTTTTTSSSSFDSSLASSILCLSPSPEEPELAPLPEDDQQHRLASSSAHHWLTTALAVAHTYYPRSLSRSQSSSSLSALAHSQDPQQGEVQGEGRVYPITNQGSSTVEVISRLTSVLGLTLLFYALLASS